MKSDIVHSESENSLRWASDSGEWSGMVTTHSLTVTLYKIKTKKFIFVLLMIIIIIIIR